MINWWLIIVIVVDISIVMMTVRPIDIVTMFIVFVEACVVGINITYLPEGLNPIYWPSIIIDMPCRDGIQCSIDNLLTFVVLPIIIYCVCGVLVMLMMMTVLCVCVAAGNWQWWPTIDSGYSPALWHYR